MATRGKVKTVALIQAKPTDWLSPDEVAELCGMTHGRVCQLLRSGAMKGEKRRGGLWEILRREAEKFRDGSNGKGRPRSGAA